MSDVLQAPSRDDLIRENDRLRLGWIKTLQENSPMTYADAELQIDLYLKERATEGSPTRG